MTNLLYKFDKPMTADDIRQWRARLNICQAHAGILLGCHERTISAYENGREIPLSVYIACVAFEHWPWLNSRIDRIIQQQSK